MFNWLLMAFMLCGSAVASADTLTSLAINSPPGDYIGQGQSYVLTQADGEFRMERNFQGQNGISLFYHNADYSHWWQIDFGGPDKALLTVGQYLEAERLGFQSTGHPGFQAWTDSRGCNTLAASFEIKHLVYGPTGEVQSFWATFTQRCEQIMPPLTGEIMFRVDQTVGTTPSTWGRLKIRYR